MPPFGEARGGPPLDGEGELCEDFRHRSCLSMPLGVADGDASGDSSVSKSTLILGIELSIISVNVSADGSMSTPPAAGSLLDDVGVLGMLPSLLL